MRRVGILLLALAMMAGSVAAAAPRAPQFASQPVETAVPETVLLRQPVDGWQDSYLSFAQANYDIFTALWPDGVGGVGFIDLDLDGTPEMVVFDQGVSASQGAQLFDLVDGQVYCVSSTVDSAGGAFDSTYLSAVHVCTNFFDSFRLSRTENGWYFWVDSTNGTETTSWDEIVRFGSSGGALSPVSVCYRYLEFDQNSGLVVQESYTVGGGVSDAAGYQAAADVYQEGEDTGYNARGVFLWSDFERYSAGLNGFLEMVQDALAAYAPIVDSVTLASTVG